MKSKTMKRVSKWVAVLGARLCVSIFVLGLPVVALAGAFDYLVVDLSGGTNTASYPVSYLADVLAGGWTDEHKTTKLVLRRIPAGAASGSGRMALGGDWYDSARHCPPARRGGFGPSFWDGLFDSCGLRVARTLPEATP